MSVSTLLSRHPEVTRLAWKVFRFGITALTALVLHFLINVVGHEVFDINVNILYPISLIVISTSTFLQCRFFVFPGASERKVARQGAEFVIATICFRLFEWACFGLLVNVLKLWYVAAIVVVQGVGTILKFVIFNLFIFNRTSSNEKRI